MTGKADAIAALHILHLEDNAVDAEQVRRALKAGGLACHCRRVDDEATFRAALAEGKFDLVLADYRLPTFDGLAAMRLVREHYPDLPLILVSGTIGEERAVECLQEGARDFVLKDRLSRLSSAVQRALQEAADRRRRRLIEAERSRLYAAVEQSEESVIITGRDGLIQYVNPTFERLTGYPRAEVEGRNPNLLKSGEHDDSFYHDFWETLTRGEVWSGRMWNRGKDGSLFCEDKTISPVRGPGGDVIAFVSLGRDITGQLELEERRQRAQKLEAIGRLAGGIAHDFNNALTAIKGYAAMARDGLPQGHPVQGDIQEIDQAADRAATLTRQLLAFGRRQIFQPRVVDLNDIMHQVEPFLRRLLPEHIQLVLQTARRLSPILADSGQLEQVMLELALNARDAMLPEGGRLLIETFDARLDEEEAHKHADLRPGLHAVVTVTDSGAGMEPEVLQRIFEPFFTAQKLGRGKGLGLATVYGIVRQSGGHISVSSAPNQGTTFKVYFPRFEGLPEKPDPTPNGPEDARLDGDETILVVEDDPTVRRLAVRMLKETRYTVLEADGGPAALFLSDRYSGRIDLLLTDVIMPEMVGPALYAALSERRPGLEVIYCSGYTGEAVASQGVLEPDIHFVQKPFTSRELLMQVRSVLDQAAKDAGGQGPD